MPDPTTPNLGLYVPLNGADVGTWDVPANANMNLLDSILGGTVSVALSNVPVTLSPAQYNNAIINFTGTLSGDVTVTLPPVGRIYTLVNNCVANVSFKVTIACSTPTTYVCLPPSEPVKVLAVNGANVAFVGLGHVGSYWDFGGSAVPIWVTGSNPVPYLNCDGTAFSSASFPALRDYLGVATLPDARGRFRATLNQGTGLLTGLSSLGGLDATTLLTSGSSAIQRGGSQTMTVNNMPIHSHGHSWFQGTGETNVPLGQSLFGFNNMNFSGPNAVTGSNIIIDNAGGSVAYAPPSYVGGLTLIRAG